MGSIKMKDTLLACVTAIFIVGSAARPQNQFEYDPYQEYDGEVYQYYDGYDDEYQYGEGEYVENEEYYEQQEEDGYDRVEDILETSTTPRTTTTTTTTTTTAPRRRPPVNIPPSRTNQYNPEESWYERRRGQVQTSNQRSESDASSVNERQEPAPSTGQEYRGRTEQRQRERSTQPTPYRKPVETANSGGENRRAGGETAETGGAEDGEDSGDCGEECRNKLHYYGYRKEDDRCPEGQVIDIWGYCRGIFHEERRDWRWWENIRHYVYSNGNSWYGQHQPDIHQQMYYNHFYVTPRYP